MSLPDQFKEILDVVGRSLSNVHTYHEKEIQNELRRRESVRQQQEKLKKIQRGEWHDGRLDCVAGNGIMSELGVGDERFGSDDADPVDIGAGPLDPEPEDENKSGDDIDAIKGLPVVVIRGFEDKVGGGSELLDVVAQWATSLVDNRVREEVAPAFCGFNAPHLDRTCRCVERQPGKRQAACEGYRCCLCRSQAVHSHLCSQSLEPPQHNRPL